MASKSKTSKAYVVGAHWPPSGLYLQETLQTFGSKEVSYVLRDPTDERAFGFVGQTAEHKLKFYAIKTADAVR